MAHLGPISAAGADLTRRVEIEQLRASLLMLQRELEQLKAVMKRKDRANQIENLNLRAELNVLKAHLQTITASHGL
jgi:hypothetical protein